MKSDLTSLEIASGLVFGMVDDVEPLPEPEPGKSPQEAFEDAVLAGLLRPPCVVSFSGGRDSSAVLAVAVHVARKHGTEEPIPVSLRFLGVESTDESAWRRRWSATSASVTGSGWRSMTRSTPSAPTPSPSSAATGCCGPTTPISTCPSASTPEVARC